MKRPVDGVADVAGVAECPELWLSRRYPLKFLTMPIRTMPLPLLSSLALLLIAASSAVAMEPVQIGSSAAETSGPAAVSAAVRAEQTSLDASCRDLRAQAAASDQPLLEQGPRHPRTSPLLSVGF